MSSNSDGTRVIIGVAGMTSDACALSIVSALSKLPGVYEVDMVVEECRVVVAGHASLDAAIVALETLGYSAYGIGARTARVSGQIRRDGEDRATDDRSEPIRTPPRRRRPVVDPGSKA